MIENTLNDPRWDIGKLGNTRRGDRKMRNFTVGLISGLIALAGFAGSASASATIDLFWDATGTDTISGLQATSTDIVLNVVVTGGAEGVNGVGISVDYSALLGDFSVVTFSNTAAAPLGFVLGATTDDSILGIVSNINGGNFCGAGSGGCLTAGSSHLLGTITFTSLTGNPGTFTVTPFIDGALTSTDDIVNGLGANISGTSNFNSGFAVVPEPGTLSLLSMGLGGLYMVGRRSSRKR
jgi:hypothetical protein